MVITEESFATFWRDGQALFAEHAAEVGPRDGVTLDINVELVERLEELGASQILTARCNGRLFGYPMAPHGLPNAVLKQEHAVAISGHSDAEPGFGRVEHQYVLAPRRALQTGEHRVG